MDHNGSIPKILERSWAPAPLWQVERQSLPKAIAADMSCDTVIVGAGITGLSVANALSKSQKVIVLDARRIGEGSSGWNAGILSVDTTIDLRIVESIFGDEKAKMLVASLVDVLAATKKNLALNDSVWQSGSSLYFAAKASHAEHLKEELQIRTKYALPTKMLDRAKLQGTWRGFAAGLELDSEHGVHPVKLLLTLADAIAQKGSLVFEDSPVSSWEHVGDRFVVRAGNGYVVQAANLVLATGLRSSEFSESDELSRLLVPVVGHVLVTEPSQHFARLVAEGGPIAFWDSLELYHYGRYLPDGRLLVGGEETPGVVPGTVLNAFDPHIQRLYQWARKHHAVKLPPIQHCWRASLVIPADGLPLVKFRRIKDNCLVTAVTDGLPFGMLLGNVVAEALLCGCEDRIERLLSYRRRLALAAKLLQWLPEIKSLRSFAYRIAFAAMRLRDRLL